MSCFSKKRSRRKFWSSVFLFRKLVLFFSLVGVMLQLGPFSWEFDVYWEEFPAKRCHEKCYTVLPTYSELEPVNAQWGLLFYHSHMYRFFIRVRPRFFDQVRHQTTSASIGKKYFFTKECHRQTYQNYEQCRQKLGTFLVNKVL